MYASINFVAWSSLCGLEPLRRALATVERSMLVNVGRPTMVDDGASGCAGEGFVVDFGISEWGAKFYFSLREWIAKCIVVLWK